MPDYNKWSKQSLQSHVHSTNAQIVNLKNRIAKNPKDTQAKYNLARTESLLAMLWDALIKK